MLRSPTVKNIAIAAFIVMMLAAFQSLEVATCP